jgi:hypothetical protein
MTERFEKAAKDWDKNDVRTPLSRLFECGVIAEGDESMEHGAMLRQRGFRLMHTATVSSGGFIWKGPSYWKGSRWRFKERSSASSAFLMFIAQHPPRDHLVLILKDRHGGVHFGKPQLGVKRLFADVGIE